MHQNTDQTASHHEESGKGELISQPLNNLDLEPSGNPDKYFLSIGGTEVGFEKPETGFGSDRDGTWF